MPRGWGCLSQQPMWPDSCNVYENPLLTELLSRLNKANSGKFLAQRPACAQGMAVIWWFILLLLFLLTALLLKIYDKQVLSRAIIMSPDGHVVLGSHTQHGLWEVLDKCSQTNLGSAIGGPEGICTATLLQSCRGFAPSLVTSSRLSPGPLDIAADPEKTPAAGYRGQKSDQTWWEAARCRGSKHTF